MGHPGWPSPKGSAPHAAPYPWCPPHHPWVPPRHLCVAPPGTPRCGHTPGYPPCPPSTLGCRLTQLGVADAHVALQQVVHAAGGFFLRGAGLWVGAGGTQCRGHPKGGVHLPPQPSTVPAHRSGGALPPPAAWPGPVPAAAASPSRWPLCPRRGSCCCSASSARSCLHPGVGRGAGRVPGGGRAGMTKDGQPKITKNVGDGQPGVTKNTQGWPAKATQTAQGTHKEGPVCGQGHPWVPIRDAHMHGVPMGAQGRACRGLSVITGAAWGARAGVGVRPEVGCSQGCPQPWGGCKGAGCL